MANELRYSVEDMSCNHCGGAITRGVEAVENVDSVDVDLDSKQVTVHGLDLVEQVIADAILLAGYSPRLVS
jgi:copper chaperone